MSARMCMQFCCAVLRIKKALGIFGRPYYRSRLCHRMSSVCLSVCLSVCDVLYPGETVHPGVKVSITAYRKSYTQHRFLPQLQTFTFVQRLFQVMSQVHLRPNFFPSTSETYLFTALPVLGLAASASQANHSRLACQDRQIDLATFGLKRLKLRPKKA